MYRMIGGAALAVLLAGSAAQATDGPIRRFAQECNGPAIRFLRSPVTYLRGNREVFSIPEPIGPFNNNWLRPYGGFTLYPGQPGSGYGSHSDYSHIDYLVTPQENANLVAAKLKAMGIPAVAPEPIFLGKNPRITDNVKLPRPRPVEKKAPDKMKIDDL